jgi:hypothetical protein
MNHSDVTQIRKERKKERKKCRKIQNNKTNKSVSVVFQKFKMHFRKPLVNSEECDMHKSWKRA